MIRNVLFGISLLTLSGTAAFAAPAVNHTNRARIVAQAGDAPAPSGDKAAAPAAKKEKKHTKKTTKDGAAKEMKASPEKTPAPATK